MTKSPILWGAGLACALGGAIAGNALGSTPMTDRAAIGLFYQTHDMANANGGDARALPDHYPLVTRRGVTPVEQLSDRGLFSQARYRSFEAVAVAADSYSYDDPGPGPAFEDDAVPQVQMAEPTSPQPPLALAEGPAQVNGQARIIDVQATLAMR